MIGKGTASLTFGLLFLSTSAAAALASQAWTNRGKQTKAREFQHLVGGLGSGPAVDLAGCPCCFDARLADGCRSDLGPIPGGGFFCPEHGCSIFYCSGLHPPPAEKESGHAVPH